MAPSQVKRDSLSTNFFHAVTICVAHLVLLAERLVLLVLDDELRLELLGRLDEGAVPLLRALLQRVRVLQLGAVARVLQPNDVLAEILKGRIS